MYTDLNKPTDDKLILNYKSKLLRESFNKVILAPPIYVEAKNASIENSTKATPYMEKKTLNIIRRSNRLVTTISTHKFPFDIFPSTIELEESRITIIKRHMFSSQIHSIDIRNIANVLLNTTFFYSQLIIISKTFEQNEIKIKNLITNEAILLRRLIEGLRVFENQKIDTSNFTKSQLIYKLKQLSTRQIDN